MRIFLLSAAAFLLGAVAASAQVQEKKLIDRIMQPDMSLQNDAQNMRYNPGGTQTTKQARTKTFRTEQRRPEKEFRASRSFFARIFGTRKSRAGDVRANLTPRNQITTAQIAPVSSSYALPRRASGTEKSYEVSEFSGTRPFLGRGKSQKSLSAQDRPLTIDQVRELLNKNK